MLTLILLSQVSSIWTLVSICSDQFLQTQKDNKGQEDKSTRGERSLVWVNTKAHDWWVRAGQATASGYNWNSLLSQAPCQGSLFDATASFTQKSPAIPHGFLLRNLGLHRADVHMRQDIYLCFAVFVCLVWGLPTTPCSRRNFSRTRWVMI